MKKTVIYPALIALATFGGTGFILSGCSDSGSGEATEETSEEGGAETEGNYDLPTSDSEESAEIPDNVATCLWAELSIREEPDAKGKYLTTIYLGENVEYLGETKVDEESAKKREYLKVKLSDGTVGWVQSNLMAVKAKEYAIIKDAKIYKRPDFLTVTEQKFEEKMYVVAIEEETDGFIKVKGKPFADSWFKEGWVNKVDLSDRKEDLDFAKMYGKAMAEKDESKRMKAIKTIMEIEQLQSSTFIANGSVQLANANSNFLSAYECFLNGECHTDTRNFPTMSFGRNELGMFAEGLQGLLYYNGMIACLDQFAAPDVGGDMDYWGDAKYAIFKSMSGGIEPTLKRGYNYNTYKPTEHGFDHINPEIVKWAYTNMIPDPDQEIGGVKAQVVYDKVMSRMFRTHARAYFYMRDRWEEEEQAYRTMMANTDNVYLPTALEKRYAGKLSDVTPQGADDQYYYSLTPAIACGFWARRYMDGSYKECWNGLERGLELYDADWLEQERIDWQ